MSIATRIYEAAAVAISGGRGRYPFRVYGRASRILVKASYSHELCPPELPAEKRLAGFD